MVRPGSLVSPPSPSTPREREQIDRLYRAHREQLRCAALGMGVDEHEAEDLVQATFMIAQRRLAEFRGQARASTWLYGILFNLHRNHRRSRSRRRRRDDDYASARDPAASRDERGFHRHLLTQLLADLDEQHRELVLLSAGAGLSGAELAAALELNHNTVYARLRSIRQQLRSRAEANR